MSSRIAHIVYPLMGWLFTILAVVLVGAVLLAATRPTVEVRGRIHRPPRALDRGCPARKASRGALDARRQPNFMWTFQDSGQAPRPSWAFWRVLARCMCEPGRNAA